MNAITQILHALGDTKVGKFTVKHAPQISMVLGGLFGVGALATTSISTKRTIDLVDAEKVKRAEKANEDAKKSQGEKSGEQKVVKVVKPEDIKLSPKEVAGLAWKVWIVPAGLAAGSLISFISAYKLEHNKTLVLAGMVSSSEAKLIAMDKEMIEKLGEKKAEEIKRELRDKDIPKEEKTDEPAKEIQNEEPQTPDSPVKIEAIEAVTGQKFKTKMSNLKLAIKDGRNRFKDDGEIDLNTWLCILEDETGESLQRSSVGENLKIIKTSPGLDFEKHVIRIAWSETEDHEPRCYIEYREPWIYED